MKKTVRKIVIGYILSIIICIPFVVSGQSSVSVMVSGDGQLRTIPYDPIVDGLVTYDSFLPQHKPLLKSVIIKMYRLFSDYGELKRTEESYTTSVMYDRNGNIVEVSNSSFNKSVRIRYESNRIVELKHGDNPKFKYVYIYDSNGRLSTILHGEWTNKCNLDSNGNIVSVKDYYGVNEYENHITYQYDSDHRMIAFHDNGSNKKDIYWNYDKKGNLVSYREIKYLKNGEKKEEHEYQFEYGPDGNPTRCVDYLVGDITKIDCGYEYEYAYSYFLPADDGLQSDEEVFALKPGRAAKTLFRPSMMDCNDCTEKGRIVVDILVDSQGDVVKASIAEGTDITNVQMHAKTLEAAGKLKFEPDLDPDAPIQKGTISFTFP